MPIYTYRCKNCGTEFDDILSMKDADKYVGSGCGTCNAGKLIRVPTCGSFIIHGYSEANGYSSKKSNKKQ